jgi:putative flippase GtrA
VKALLERLFADERVRFLFIGGINTVVGYGLFVAIQLTAGDHVGYLGSLYISYAVGIVVAFILHRRFTFRVTGNLIVDFLRFASVYVVSLAINTVVLPLIVEFGHISPLPAQAITLVVTTVISYVGHKLFSFRRQRVEEEPGPVQSQHSVTEQ